MRVIATIEARLAASRLPGKVMFPLAGATMLERLIERLRQADQIDEVVVATTIAPPDSVIAELSVRTGCRAHRGSVEDIAGRLLGASQGADVVVQITGDCPLIDPAHVDETIRLLLAAGADYASNNLGGRTFPLGFDVQCFTRAALERTGELTNDPIDRVHGSYFIYRNPQLFKLVGWEAPPDQHWPELRLTVDEAEDYELVRRIFAELYPSKPAFTAIDVIALLRNKPEWVALNSAVRQKTLEQG